MGNVALTDDRGLILNRIIEFSPQGATIFYWVVAIAALASWKEASNEYGFSFMGGMRH